MQSMYFTSKKSSLLILLVTSLVCSRTMFFFFDDPEGPNLLVVTLAALIIFCVTLPMYMCVTRAKLIRVRTFRTQLLLAILFQILITTIFYFCLYL